MMIRPCSAHDLPGSPVKQETVAALSMPSVLSVDADGRTMRMSSGRIWQCWWHPRSAPTSLQGTPTPP
ncbi:hypothetical protein COCSADRAFT_265998 [Bipolaris sorokiniana ND90Pr]|uniref:Uncharacterized protein n=1 Tax=Cochliobolus sativus (strain ND90Pr / ATCC 201652) TaxID=665912 RepID=M2SNM5_COCSN|nr:uncharacterized protein COCSADRAFT_265998 [Bipolaris sorokiniana ND90Pr]EMD58741.1 hypothetical protein COCSADRAFT_265998 [Bipolaris sorokiniana ND90Pr]